MNFKKPKFWENINFLSIFLLPLSLITFLFNILKSKVITEHRFNVPIICVGNIFIGGTGKTPLSVYIYNLLKKKKIKACNRKKILPFSYRWNKFYKKQSKTVFFR